MLGVFKGLRRKWAELIDMYDMILANLYAGNSIIEPDKRLDVDEVAIGFSNIASEYQINKYFVIRQFPDYLQPRLFDLIRNRCLADGVKINFYIYAEPYKIDWNSPEMRNKMYIWRQYSKDVSSNVDVFDYRNKRKDILAKERIVLSTKYLNEAELDFKRSLLRASFLIELSCNRDDDSLYNMSLAIRDLKGLCSQYDIKLTELRVNMIDWLRYYFIFGLKELRDVVKRVPKKILTDDILSNFNSYKQGKVGKEGVCLGVDISTKTPVLKKFKADPDAAENWLIAAETGGGKSYFVKSLLTYLLADGFVITVMDYEGDEYINLASYIKAGNPDDVKVVSMGKGSTIYFDPMEIPDLTGDEDVDNDLKETAINYTLAIFRIIVAGLDGELTQWEERVITTAIQRVYDSVGVTEDKTTWHRSKGLRLHMVYEEVKNMVESKELVDYDSDNIKHKAAIRVMEASSIYFEEGGVRSSVFKTPMSLNDLYKARFIVFSFGMKGAGNSTFNKTILALKQLTVACISTQISNYCKYVKKCFNVKVWEEFQRWGEAEGSSEIILNAMTGGRKRGDVNFVITNNLADILNSNNKVASGIRQNIQNIAVGKIKDKSTREQFCEKFDLKDSLYALDKIAKAHNTDELSSKKSNTSNRYKNAFCVILDNGKKAVVKVMMPPSLVNSKLFKTGVDVENKK
ncbi:MAG: DUF87 domain-containing protein [Candidatus Anstonellales archaeon]